MISPGLLGSAPVRAAIDMLNAANGQVHVAEVLAGLLERPGDEGPALATDLFAAFVVAGGAAARGGREEEGSSVAGLQSRVSSDQGFLPESALLLWGASQHGHCGACGWRHSIRIGRVWALFVQDLPYLPLNAFGLNYVHMQ